MHIDTIALLPQPLGTEELRSPISDHYEGWAPSRSLLCAPHVDIQQTFTLLHQKASLSNSNLGRSKNPGTGLVITLIADDMWLPEAKALGCHQRLRPLNPF